MDEIIEYGRHEAPDPVDLVPRQGQPALCCAHAVDHQTWRLFEGVKMVRHVMQSKASGRWSAPFWTVSCQPCFWKAGGEGAAVPFVVVGQLSEDVETEEAN